MNIDKTWIDMIAVPTIAVVVWVFGTLMIIQQNDKSEYSSSSKYIMLINQDTTSFTGCHT